MPAEIETEEGRREGHKFVIGGLMLAVLLAALDQTIVSAALPTNVGELGGLNHLSWVVTAYLLAVTVGTPRKGTGHRRPTRRWRRCWLG